MGVEVGEELGENMELEVVADFEGVAGMAQSEPSVGEVFGEAFEGVMALGIGEGAGPDPLDAQRGFAPAFGFIALVVGDAESDAGAGDGGQCFRAELERDAGSDRQEIEAERGDVVDDAHFSLATVCLWSRGRARWRGGRGDR